MAGKRKSAARMRTYRPGGDKTDADAKRGSTMTPARDVKRADGTRVPLVINTSRIPKDEYERINAHRMPIATWIRDVTRRHARNAARRQHDRIMHRARRRARHPYARQHAVTITIVLAFAAVAVGGIIVGGNTVRDANTNTAANAANTTSTDALTTTRGQRHVLVATGLYDTFMLTDGMPIAELLDGNVTPSEASARKKILDASVKRVTPEATNGNDEDDKQNTTNDNVNEEVASPRGGLGNASGTLTSDQENEGRQEVMDALNRYAGNMRDKTNELSERLGDGNANDGK